MIELVDVTQRLAPARHGHLRRRAITVDRAQLVEPEQVRPRIPLVVGGNGRRVLTYAAEHADVVALSGLGRTLEDGHRHEAMWADAEADAQTRCTGTDAKAGQR